MTEFRSRAGNAAREGTAPASPGRRTPSLRVRAVPGRRQAGRACHRGVHAYRLACLRTSGFLETARVRGRGTLLTRAHPGTGRSRHAHERLGPARAGRPARGDRCRAGQHRCGVGPASGRPRRLDIPRAAAGRKGAAGCPALAAARVVRAVPRHARVHGAASDSMLQDLDFDCKKYHHCCAGRSRGDQQVFRFAAFVRLLWEVNRKADASARYDGCRRHGRAVRAKYGDP
jgi:hypothetical protein